MRDVSELTLPVPAGTMLRRVPPRRARRSRGLPAIVYVGFAVFAALGLSTSNPGLTAAAVVVLAVILHFLTRPGETPILAFAVGMQWLQVVTWVFEADYRGITLNELGGKPMLDTAVWLGLAGVTALALGMHVVLRRLAAPPAKVVDQWLRTVSIERLFILHMGMLAISVASQRLLWSVLSIAQALMAVNDARWAVYFIMAVASLRFRRKPGYLLVATAVEFVLGIGFFSGFKTVLLMLVIAAIASGRRFNLRSTFVVTVVGAVTMYFALTWQAVKQEYRAYLNQGTHQQVVLVSPGDELSTFSEMVGDVDASDLSRGFESLLDRLAYVDLFADVLARVPDQIPFEHGALLRNAIQHALMPRMFFPDKPILDSDSDETMYYTGLNLAGRLQGTSIGLGYMVEQYIDFGPTLMFLAIFCIGMAWGWMYRYILTRRCPWSARFAVATALMIYAASFEMVEAKLIGGMLSHFLLYALLLRYALPGLLRWLAPAQVAA